LEVDADPGDELQTYVRDCCIFTIATSSIRVLLVHRPQH